LLALVDDTFDAAQREAAADEPAAAAFSYPHLMGPAQQLFERLYGEFAETGPKAGQALAIAAALDGISLLELLNLHKFTKHQREAMRQALHQMAQELG
jgi:hypothetical protein